MGCHLCCSQSEKACCCYDLEYIVFCCPRTFYRKRKGSVGKGALASKMLINIGEEVDGGAHYVWHCVGTVFAVVAVERDSVGEYKTTVAGDWIVFADETQYFVRRIGDALE